MRQGKALKKKGISGAGSGAHRNHDEDKFERVLTVPLKRIRRFSTQPREHFANITELAASISTVGQLQPGTIVKINGDPDHDYELVDGERRFLACKEAGLETYRAMLISAVDIEQRFQISVASNFNRQDHAPMEIAFSLNRLKEAGCSAEKIAIICGKSVPWVYQYLNLLKLDSRVQELMRPELPDDSRLAFSAAVMLSSFSPDKQVEAARAIVGGRLKLQAAQHHIKGMIAADPSIQKGRKNRTGEQLQVFRRTLERAERQTGIWTGYPEGYVSNLVKNGSEELLDSLIETINGIIGNLHWLKLAMNGSGDSGRSSVTKTVSSVGSAAG